MEQVSNHSLKHLKVICHFNRHHGDQTAERSAMSVGLCHTTWCHNPEDSILKD